MRSARCWFALTCGLTLLSHGCGDPPGSARDLLTVGSARLTQGEGGDGRTLEVPPGPVVLSDGERVVFYVEVVSSSVLELGVLGDAGQLDVEIGIFEPIRGQAAIFSPCESFQVKGGAGLYERLDLPEASGGALAIALSWAAVEPRSQVTVDRLVLREKDALVRPSFIFISIDTFSASHMSLYGYERETTPALDRLAEESVTFDGAMANATWTKPSYVSQLTGLLPGACQIAPWAWTVPEDRWTLAEMLRGRGYRTAAYIDNPNAGARHGLAQGFQVFDDSAAKVTATDTEGGIRHVLPLAEAWIDEALQDGAPFFLLVQVADLHGPYVAPPEFVDEFEGDGLYAADHTLPIEAPHGTMNPLVDGTVPQYALRGFAEQITDTGHAYTAPLLDAYDEQVTALDEAIGSFLERLRSIGVYEDAIIVVSADHGETMLEHDVHFRHVHNYQENLLVPLIIRLPGGRNGNSRVPDYVQLVDLYPTFAELAGLSPDTHALHGRSLVPLLNGETRPPRPVLSEAGVSRSDSIVWEGWKLIVSYPGHGHPLQRLSHRRTRQFLKEFEHSQGDFVIGSYGWQAKALAAFEELGQPKELAEGLLELVNNGEPYYQLFNLDVDPRETTNLGDSEPERLSALLDILEDQRSRGRLARSQVQADQKRVILERTQEELDELKKLGYAADE